MIPQIDIPQMTDDSLHKIIKNWYKHNNKFGHIIKNVMVTALIVSVFFVLLMAMFRINISCASEII